jgi:membrane dipeptidase
MRDDRASCRQDDRVAPVDTAFPLWDQHVCLPLVVGTSIDPLARFARPAGAVVSVNVGYAPHRFADVVALLASFRGQIAIDPRFRLVVSSADVQACLQIREIGEIGVVFDLEDSGPLDGDLDNLDVLRGLGVRSLVPTYNSANAAGSGCLDSDDGGLTSFGRDLVARMNAVGMIPDGSHASVRTGLDLCRHSDRPVIYSHSNMRAVWDHPRNLTDDQARACAETGGVVGITGVGIFLGPNTPTVDAMLAQIDYAVELIGIDHVGLGSDYPFDADDFARELTDNPELFPDDYTRWGPIAFMPPEETTSLGVVLRRHGYSPHEVEAITHRNFARVHRATPSG